MRQTTVQFVKDSQNLSTEISSPPLNFVLISLQLFKDAFNPVLYIHMCVCEVYQVSTTYSPTRSVWSGLFYFAQARIMDEHELPSSFIQWFHSGFTHYKPNRVSWCPQWLAGQYDYVCVSKDQMSSLKQYISSIIHVFDHVWIMSACTSEFNRICCAYI